MFTVEELHGKIDEYQQRKISLEAFDHWFEDNSIAAYADPELADIYAAVDGALAEYYFDHIGEDNFREELAKAVRPFVQSPREALAFEAPKFAGLKHNCEASIKPRSYGSSPALATFAVAALIAAAVVLDYPNEKAGSSGVPIVSAPPLPQV